MSAYVVLANLAAAGTRDKPLDPNDVKPGYVALGIVWIAAALSRGRRAGTGRAQPSYTPVPGAPYGPVATEEPSAASVADPYPPVR